MQFARHLRHRIASGEITCSVRVWQRPHVKAGNFYRVEGGRIRVDSIREIAPEEVTDELARRGGFDNRADLMETAKHGKGENTYLVEFTFIAPEGKTA